MAEGLDFLIPSLLFMKGALIDNQRSSNKFAASEGVKNLVSLERESF